jgi:hypothetical protein
MTRSEFSKLFVAAGRILLAYVLVFSQSAWGAQNQKTEDKKSSQESSVEQTGAKPPAAVTTAKQQTEEAQGEASEKFVAEEKSGDPSHQGIKVHGHWTIEVSNPNGSLVSRREFENNLSSPKALAGVLGRQNSVGSWAIFLTPTSDTTGCGFFCRIFEPNVGASTAPDTSTNLLVTVTNIGSTLTLSGSIAAPSSLQIGTVYTRVGLCAASTSATSCSAGGSTLMDFTGTTLAAPIAAQAGQTIAVTVTISFS